MMYDPEPTREAWHLLRKLFLLTLVVTATALGLVILSRAKSHVPQVLFTVLADTSLGLLAGFATRFALKGRHGLIQGLASGAASLIGLAVLGYFTGWRNGIGPFQAGLVTVHVPSAPTTLHLPLAFGSSGMNMLDLLNAVIAMDTSWMALRVWKNGTHVNGQSLAPMPHIRRPVRQREIREDPIEPVVATPVVVPSVAPAPRRAPAPSTSGSGSRARIRRKKTADRAVIARPTSALHPVRSRVRHNTQRRPRVAVHLAVHEEHKCPYCFQPVSRNDPRGVVECQICHTLHHKDCWDITGNCQVPHLTTL